MKISYNWLKEYCEFDMPAHELAERLSHAGLNVDTYEPRGSDYMLEVEVTTNRPDCLCHLGLAREVAALTGSEARRPSPQPVEDAELAFQQHAHVQVDTPQLCPHYTARLIKGVKVGPSPDWMQQRLITCGLRPVNNVVDITNYVMFESGQPLHAFDFSLLQGQKVIVRRAQAGEVITTIDGKERELTGEECVIADAAKPIAVGGVMGGVESEISDSTTDVLLEAARFDLRSIRRTSRHHGLISDSSYRYERGIDPEITEWASRRAAELILEMAGGRLCNGMADIRSDTTETPQVTLRMARLSLLLGISVPQPEVVSIFRGLGLDICEQTAGTVTVRVPSWRPDLRREVDLVEEVARLHGYDKIADVSTMPIRPVSPSKQETAERRTRALLAGQGFDEVMTYSLVSPSALQLAQPWHDGPPLALRNPVSAERTHMRLTNMANMLGVKRFNQAHGTDRVDLFELSRVYVPRPGEDQPEEKLCLSMLTDREDGLRVLKGVLANVLEELGIDTPVEEVPECAGAFRADGALVLRIDGELLGCAGVASDEAVAELDLRHAPALMECDFHRLVELTEFDRPYAPIASYPATRRDLAIVVRDDVLWADVQRVVLGSATELLETLEFFDVYVGDPVPHGHKSIAFSLTFRRQDGTITAEEAEQARAHVVDALSRELGATLR